MGWLIFLVVVAFLIAAAMPLIKEIQYERRQAAKTRKKSTAMEA